MTPSTAFRRKRKEQPGSPDDEAQRWAEENLGQAQLGDVRRTRRLIQVGADMLRNLGQSVLRASGGDDAAVEAAYRFARNEAIEPEAIAESGFTATVARAASFPCLLEIQDSTTLSYGHQVAGELGDLGGGENAKNKGFWVHSSLVVDPANGQSVGLGDMQIWTRPVEQRGQRHQRTERPYKEKESFKWQRATEALRGRFGPEIMRRMISISDRESDVYPYLCDKIAHQERFVIRACWDRRVRYPNDEQWMPLWDAWPSLPLVGTMTIAIPQRGGRPARLADVTVRAGSLHLKRSKILSADYPPQLAINVVTVCEEAPAGESAPLEWVLLTTEPIDTPEQVALIIDFYRQRWRIEEFHKAWKLGVGVERLRMQSPGNLLRMAVLFAFLAVRLLQLREQMEQSPESPCSGVLSPLEWKVLWAAVEKKNLPRKVPSTRWAYYALARLGGWIDTKRTGRVGWLTLWRGWDKLYERIEGYHTAAIIRG